MSYREIDDDELLIELEHLEQVRADVDAAPGIRSQARVMWIMARKEARRRRILPKETQ